MPTLDHLVMRLWLGLEHALQDRVALSRIYVWFVFFRRLGHGG